ncbi:Vps5-domain-containing protein [Tilletiaria anomala UBC 951]|uniref:Vps5-domain-containing protein n=1 Tax=Tilletiaria anomala (strain ATCC 24038 / CBS 436.72 / UBC 951) TaxID=1037660 RepID=A0A066VND0_TILAU|nr:Vps5-domain-containing protein [Tilletiaria anomala UBC 951]KDN40095.1 Vps5-domain-containing protein [Tilletiaria anomala UBC 951]
MSSKPRVVVTGASGLLGRAVFERCKTEGYDVKGLAYSRARDGLTKLNLTSTDEVYSFLSSIKPHVIIHCAAERRPDVVEKDPEGSEALNVGVPTHLAQWCAFQEKEGGQPAPLLINISTDYVFDGSKPPYKVDDDPNPLNTYGVSKLRGERAVSEHGIKGRSVNFRVPVLYGYAESPDESAVNILLTTIQRPSQVPSALKKMDAYAVRYPTNVSDVARALGDLVNLAYAEGGVAPPSLPPTLHFSAMEAMTKYDMCNVLARVWNSVQADLIESQPELQPGTLDEQIATTEYLDPEYEVDLTAATMRPRHCKLDLSSTRELGISTDCVTFESWWKGYLTETETTRLEAERKAAAEAEECRVKEVAAAEEKRKQDAEERKSREEEEKCKREEAEAEERSARVAKEKEEAERLANEIEEERKEKERIETDKAERKQREAQELDLLHAEQQAAEQETVVKADDMAEGKLKCSTHSERRAQDPMDLVAKSIEQSDGNEILEQMQGSSEGKDEDQNENDGQGPSASNSPRPSFSSLRARPTPPASSSSPDPSMAPPLRPNSLQEAGEAILRRASAGTTSSKVHSSITPLGEPLAVTRQVSGSVASREDARSLPTALLKGDDSLISTGSTAAQDADSDGYGEPSPRLESTMPRFIDEQRAAAPVQSATAVSALVLQQQEQQPKQAHVPPQHQQPQEQGEPDFPGSGPSPGPGPGSDQIMVRSTINAVDERIADANMRDDLPAEPHQRRFTFEIKVGDPQKVGDPVTAHTVYTVRTKTDCSNFRALQFSVLRRYNDFRWLHAALVNNNPGMIVPPVPEKVKIGRFAPELVESRRHGLETCINKISNHPVLQHDDDLRLFLESDNFAHDVKMRDLRKGPVPTPEQKTYFGWSSNIGGPKFVETDEWFERQKGYLDSLESQLRKIVKAINTLAQQRKDFAHQTSEFSSMMMVLSTSSLSRAMCTCFAGLGEVQRRAQELAELQSDADMREIGTVIYEYERIVGSVRKAFATRVDAWLAWQLAEEDLHKLRRKYEKLKSEGGRVHPERLHSMLQDIADKESQSLHLKKMFDDISRRCKTEMAAFDIERVEEFRNALETWIDGMVERQEEMAKEWEHYIALLERQTGRTIDAPGSRSNVS